MQCLDPETTQYGFFHKRWRLNCILAVSVLWPCRSMVALLVSTPEVAGAAFTSELYSPHLDVHQRMLILETLASAAQQMANPRARIHASKSQMTGHGSALEPGVEAATNAALGMTACLDVNEEET